MLSSLTCESFQCWNRFWVLFLIQIKSCPKIGLNTFCNTLKSIRTEELPSSISPIGHLGPCPVFSGQVERLPTEKKKKKKGYNLELFRSHSISVVCSRKKCVRGSRKAFQMKPNLAGKNRFITTFQYSSELLEPPAKAFDNLGLSKFCVR